MIGRFDQIYIQYSIRLMSFFIGDSDEVAKKLYPDLQQYNQKSESFHSQQQGQKFNQPNWNQPPPQSGWDLQMNQGVSTWIGNQQMPPNQQMKPNQQKQQYSAWDNPNQNTSHFQGNTQGFQGNQGFNMGNQGNQQFNPLTPMNNTSNFFTTNSIFNKPPVNYQFPSPFIKYKIIPLLDEKKALDVTTVNDSDKKLKKNNLIIWDYHGGPNQQFYIKEEKNKKCYIVNVSKGFTMEVPESNGKDGVQILVNPRNDTQNQFWQLVPAGHETFQIRSFCGKVLDLSGQSTKNGTQVIQWKDNGGKNQKWKIVPS